MQTPYVAGWLHDTSTHSVSLLLMRAPLQVPYLVGYSPVTDAPQISYGLRRLDHAVGNVHNLCEAMDYIMGFTGGQAAGAVCTA